MTGRPDSFMPLYTGDYRRSTGHLGAAEHGAYLLLLMHYWDTGRPLPADEAVLTRIACLSAKEWRAHRTTLLAFFSLEDGAYRHKRVAKELAKAVVKYEKRSEAGRRGNAKRWGAAKRSPGDAPGDANARRNASAGRSQPHGSLSTKGEPVAARAPAPGNGAGARPATEPAWEAAHPKWAELRDKIGIDAWRLWFADCRPNGSPTSLLASSPFAKDQLLERFADQLDAHFGTQVTIHFDPKKWSHF